MSSYIDFLTNLGFGEVLQEEFSLEDSDFYDIEMYEDIYSENIEVMKDEFDDGFIIEMFLAFNTVFMRSDFSEMLDQIREQFGTDMWSTLIAYEWNEKGNSSIFELMDNLMIGYFEANISEVCKRVRSVWVNDYGDSEL